MYNVYIITANFEYHKSKIYFAKYKNNTNYEFMFLNVFIIIHNIFQWLILIHK